MIPSEIVKKAFMDDFNALVEKHRAVVEIDTEMNDHGFFDGCAKVTIGSRWTDGEIVADFVADFVEFDLPETTHATINWMNGYEIDEETRRGG